MEGYLKPEGTSQKYSFEGCGDWLPSKNKYHPVYQFGRTVDGVMDNGAKNLIYAFVVHGRINYIGETGLALEERMKEHEEKIEKGVELGWNYLDRDSSNNVDLCVAKLFKDGEERVGVAVLKHKDSILHIEDEKERKALVDRLVKKLRPRPQWNTTQLE